MDKKPMKAPSKIELKVLRFMILVGVFSLVQFFYYFLQPAYRGATFLYVLLCIVLAYGALRNLYLWYHYYAISIPVKPESYKKYTVDILTTYFPGEPYEMICGTLKAIQKITYPHTTYLCDEANDPYLIDFCNKNGIVHVTRNHRTDAKAGNINNALKIATGEIALILDPDHIPKPNFLDEVIPYFEDEKIGYVQVVQAYYNKVHSLVARGAAEQTFHFYGPMMMSMNSYGTVNAIGANCTFRRSALDSIGGHAPGLAEDMHTSMLLHAKGWKSVYVPELVATGMAPLDLTSYFKQQLKWSRGVFELLYVVYPKIFKKLTIRQKLHYALLPMHYLIGFIYLISFAIPITSLFTSSMPWTGNFLKFIAISIPLFVSNLCIRVYVQKWVIERSERGFHVIGGVLQIVTWWIFILGVVYTFIRKKVPYLPTPKDEEGTNYKIIIPNMVIAVLSMTAIIYGLQTNITPFSICMMGFAFLNILFMLFSLYLASRITNKNEILRNSLKRDVIDFLKIIKGKIIDGSDYVFRFTRIIALPLVCFAVFISLYAVNSLEEKQWNAIKPEPVEIEEYLYKGIFYPSQNNGLSNLDLIDNVEIKNNVNFDMVSFYIPWGDTLNSSLDNKYLEKILLNNATPLITWEPWLTNFSFSDSIINTKNRGQQLNLIRKGHFDKYIKQFAISLREIKHPVFLRFAHEFDNPGYPWYNENKTAASDFVKTWRYIYDIFSKEHVDNVKWVWNPWKSNKIEEFYPGDAYVDWLGVDILNYGSLNEDGVSYSFSELYAPYKNVFTKITDKPILIAELGSLKMGSNQKIWLKNASESIITEHREIRGAVFFNSSLDYNIPVQNNNDSIKYLDWTFNTPKFKNISLFEKTINSKFVVPDSLIRFKGEWQGKSLSTNLRGVNYNKAENWFSNNYVADKNELIKDFRLMRQAGINTLKYNQSVIYDFNVLKYAEGEQLDVIYSFWIPSDLDFIKDSLRLNKLEEKVINALLKYKNQSNIIGYNFSNDIWQELSKRYQLDALDHQRYLYHIWFSDLLEKVKKVEPKRMITKDVFISQSSEMELRAMEKFNFKLDGYSAVVQEVYWFKDFSNYCDEHDKNYLVGDITVSDYEHIKNNLIDKSVFLSNWQNRWESHVVSFDGLLDFNGQKKLDYVKIENAWKERQYKLVFEDFKILKPAVPLVTDLEVTYYALFWSNGEWKYFNEQEDSILEWALVKTDNNGNYLALKKLGGGAKISFLVPENYQNYQLVLTWSKGGISKTTKEDLNLHLNF
ncbi:glycosyltransferase [Maribacter sp. M208]|uniref:glycosyltransferase n=1 Tax=Maribacter huludaoensis TaxID=3030010 RepID=UPI0023EE279B|nr:glycosyltransferase [Maribacter huludaoensis]MDF4221119.1 glycosyltransferase [Maribacter huludaoensis]